VTYRVEGRAERGASDDGAWYATDELGRRMVLKRERDSTALARFEALGRSLDALRAKGYPAPAYVAIDVDDEGILLAQSRLAGRTDVAVNERTVDDVLRLNDLQAGVDAPTLAGSAFGELLVHTLVVGEDGWCVHESLHAHSARTRALVAHAEALGASLEPAMFPTTGIVHLDLHPGNLLLHDDGSVAGVVDWEGAVPGDHRFDLTSFAYCHATASGGDALVAPVWDALAASVEPAVLYAYAVHQVVRLVDWVLRHDGAADAEVWLDAGERLLRRLRG
jgi:hypothetical protein